MKTTIINAVTIAALGLSASQGILAQGCCGSGAMKEGCGMGGATMGGGHDGHGAPAAATEGGTVKRVFLQPVQSVFDNYLKVHGALAQDTLEGVSGAASAMAKAIQSDAKHTLSANAAVQAEALSKAKDLETARAAFKSLSESLIVLVQGQKDAAGTYHVAYCPMAKASWVQTGTAVLNPYMGKEMVHCGQLKH